MPCNGIFAPVICRPFGGPGSSSGLLPAGDPTTLPLAVILTGILSTMIVTGIPSLSILTSGEFMEIDKFAFVDDPSLGVGERDSLSGPFAPFRVAIALDVVVSDPRGECRCNY